jgi:hypothetical protein
MTKFKIDRNTKIELLVMTERPPLLKTGKTEQSLAPSVLMGHGQVATPCVRSVFPQRTINRDLPIKPYPQGCKSCQSYTLTRSVPNRHHTSWSGTRPGPFWFSFFSFSFSVFLLFLFCLSFFFVQIQKMFKIWK